MTHIVTRHSERAKRVKNLKRDPSALTRLRMTWASLRFRVTNRWARNDILCFLFLFIFASAAFAENIPLKEWNDLSDTDVSPKGKAALGTGAKNWKHAETEHFVYHFADEKQAETVYISAEVYYRWIKELFGVSEDHWKRKAHVFVFEDKEIWKQFNTRFGAILEGDAFTDGWELYIYRNPFWLSPKKTLAHELTHMIVFRFLDGPIPIFLNEGFAEFVAYRAIATQFDGNEYSIRTIQHIPEDKFIPLDELIHAQTYPQGKEKIETFYRESELLVRYLILHYKGPQFYELLHKVSGGKNFERVLAEVYGLSLEKLSVDFHSFAIAK